MRAFCVAHTRLLVACVAALSLGACNQPAAEAPVTAAAEAEAAATGQPKPARWQLGSHYTYRFTSASGARMAEGAELMDMALSGVLQVRPVRVEAQLVELELVVPELTATTHKPGAQAELDTLPAQVEKPALAVYRDRALAELRLAPGSKAFADSIVRSLAAALQLSVATGQWEAFENDGTGRYVAAYRALPEPGRYEKQKLRYEAVDLAAGSDPRGRARLDAQVEASRFVLTLKDGVLARLEGEERLRVPLGNNGELRSNTRLTLELTGTGAAGATDSSALRAQTEPRELLRVTRGQAPSPALDDARIAGRTFEQALAELELEIKGRRADQAPVRSQNGEPLSEAEQEAREQALAESASAFQVMAAILRRQPEHLGKVSALVQKGKTPARTSLLWALGAAGTPASQAEIQRIARDASQPVKLRKTAAFALSRVARPGPESVEALDAWRAVPELRVIALYGLGTYARRLREAGDAARSQAIGVQLREELARATTDAERVDVLRALFNAADPASTDVLLAELASPSALVRGAAVDALGALASTEIDAALAKAITDDPDANVRSAALVALRHRAYSEPLAEAAAQAARNDAHTRCRSDAVLALGTWLPQHPELRVTIEHVATKDAREQLRVAARRLLEG